MPDADAAIRRWSAEAGRVIDSYRPQVIGESIGSVRSLADSVAVVEGLPDVGLDELLRFEDGSVGMAQVLEPDHIGCILLDDRGQVGAGSRVRGTGETIRVPVGEGLLGRVVDPLGRPLDGLGPVAADRHDPIERPAPAIIDRAEVTEPVQTGVLVVDALFALGRGQRELIIGDRATGKTAIAVDTILAQKTTDLICVYVAIGQKSAGVKRVVEALQSRGDFTRVIVVVAEAASAPGLQWIAPFAGMSMAEYFRDAGRHALVILDDLSKHADCHRQIALLTGQPAGREAYPGDIFYLHARLLERAAKLDAARGGGSLTALPIAETDAGNLSAYIPTNLISITDGQIVLDARLFNEGLKPAVNVGTSVSRVGGKTQARSLRQAADTLRLDYAQFLELEIFTRFGSVPDQRVRHQLQRGDKIRQVLAQPQYRPLSLPDQVVLLLALQAGLLDELTPAGMAAFRDSATARCRDIAPAVVAKLSRPTEMLAEEDRRQLLDCLGRFVAELQDKSPSR